VQDAELEATFQQYASQIALMNREFTRTKSYNQQQPQADSKQLISASKCVKIPAIIEGIANETLFKEFGTNFRIIDMPGINEIESAKSAYCNQPKYLLERAAQVSKVCSVLVLVIDPSKIEDLTTRPW